MNNGFTKDAAVWPLQARGTGAFLLSALMLMSMLFASSTADSRELLIYRERDGTRWITDRPMSSKEYTYVGKYGRPTAVLSCMGLKPGALETRASKYQSMIERHATSYGIDATLVKAVIRVESCFDDRAVSKVGARGLMQLMPYTAEELGVFDSFDPEENVRGGVAYLKKMLSRFSNNWNLALAAYNAGPGAVERYNGIPPFRETTSYVKKVMSHYKQYREQASSPAIP